jgi:hypothetical protein
MFFRGASAFESDKAETLTPSFNAYTHTAGLHAAALPSLDSDLKLFASSRIGQPSILFQLEDPRFATVIRSD